MRSSRVVLAAIVGAVVPMLAAASVYAELKVGVVDTIQVTNDYDRTKDANADLQVEQANLKAAWEPKAKKVEELRLRRDGFNRGTEEWKKANEEALKSELEARTWLALEQAKIESKHREVLLDMYRQINVIVGRIAKTKALDIVFTKAFLTISLEEGAGLEDLKNRIMNQRVLYPAATEITTEVLKTLNDEYKASKKSAGGTEKTKG